MTQITGLSPYEAAKKSISSKLHPDMLSWSYERMMEDLVKTIESIRLKGEKNPVRSFARHHLKLRGDNIDRLVRGWVRDNVPMTEEQAALVLVALSDIRGRVGDPFSEKEKAVTRRFVSFLIISLTQILHILSELGTKPASIDEGDRIEMRRIMKEICARLGIDVSFPEDASNLKPVTRQALANLGLSQKTQTKAKK